MQNWFIHQLPHGLLEIIFLTVSCILIVLYFSNLIRKFSLLKKFHKKYQTVEYTAKLPSISVIIVAYNEFRTLPKLIEMLEDQNYPDFEIILVNDGSTDGTDAWAAQHAMDNPKFKYTYLNPDYFKRNGKKIGVTMAIKKALNNCLVFVDGDCEINSNEYLLHYGNAFANNFDLIVGVSPHNYKGNLLHNTIKIETLKTAFNYTSAVLLNKTYMAVGRNMGYTKDLYLSVNGFENHYHIPCGDDDLFVQDVKLKAKATILTHIDSQSNSNPSSNWKNYFNTRVRHLYASKFYNLSSKLYLGYPLLLQIVFIISLIAFALFSSKWLIALVLYFIYLVFKSIILNLVHKLLFHKPLKLIYMFYAPFYQCIQCINAVNHFFAKKVRWKHSF